MKPINVLSLFDGMACGLVALKRAGIPVKNYYASEIDPYAIKVAKNNHPEIKYIGCVTKWAEWDLPKIDLLLGGSPCQGFSFAGKQLNFNDPRSQLFFDYVYALTLYQPKYFLLENVIMKQEFQNVINNYLNVKPKVINASLVSAQNRERLYWFNINDVKQPRDRGILLKDITLDRSERVARMVGRRINKEGKRADYDTSIKRVQRIEPRLDNKAGTITTVQKDNLVLTDKALSYMSRKVKGGRTHWDFKHHSDINNKKSAAVVANFFKGVPYNVLIDNDCIRYFHPVECERLQTLPDEYTEGVSTTQRLKMLGNGWTVDVIAHILKNIKR